jgi:hypothetical protein
MPRRKRRTDLSGEAPARLRWSTAAASAAAEEERRREGRKEEVEEEGRKIMESGGRWRVVDFIQMSGVGGQPWKMGRVGVLFCYHVSIYLHIYVYMYN